MNFNAIEFDDLSSRIDNWNRKIAADETKLLQYTRELSEYVRSDDSDVANMVMNVNATIAKYREKLASAVSELNIRLKRYQAETIANETATTKALASIDSRVGSVISSLDSISWE